MTPFLCLAIATVSTAGPSKIPGPVGDLTHAYTALNRDPIAGIYNASGTLLTNTVNVQSVSHELLYATDYGMPYYLSIATGTYRSKVTFTFSNSNWSSYAGGSSGDGAVGFKAIHYAVSGSTTSICEQVIGTVSPPATGISTAYLYYSLGWRPSTETFIDVKPKRVMFSELTVDPLDNKKGYVLYDNGPIANCVYPNPWDNLVPSPLTRDWVTGVWLFPRWTYDGFYTQRQLPAYPVNPFPATKSAKR